MTSLRIGILVICLVATPVLPSLAIPDSLAAFDAAESGDIPTIAEQLSAGLDVNYINSLGDSLLRVAVVRRQMEVLTYLLTEAHADPNLPKRDAPLIAACERIDSEIVEILLNSGADPNTKDWARNTPLLQVLGNLNSDSESQKERAARIVYMLLKAGARIDDVDPGEPTVLDLADRKISEIRDALRSPNPTEAMKIWGMDWDKALLLQETEDSRRKAHEAVAMRAKELKAEAIRVKAEKESAARWRAHLTKLRRRAPLHIIRTTLSQNTIGTPVMEVSFLNASTKAIDAVEVAIRCNDNFGRPVRGFGRIPTFQGIYQQLIPAESMTDVSWTLHGYGIATKCSAKIVRIHFLEERK